MLCAAIDIGSNTTRVLVAEPVDGQLKKVMEQRAYTRINKALDDDGAICAEQDRRGRRGRRHPGAAGAGARRRDDPGRRHRRGPRGDQRRAGGEGDRRGRRGRGRHPQRRGGGPALLHRRDEDPRPPGLRADRRRRRRRRLDRGDPRHASRTASRRCAPGRSAPASSPTSCSPPTRPRRRRSARSATASTTSSTGSRSTTRRRRSRSAAARPRCAGWSARCSSTRPWSAAIRVLCGDPAADVARRFELDPDGSRILATGVLLLEKISELLGQPLQIGKGGLREGVILDLLNGSANGSSSRLAACSPPRPEALASRRGTAARRTRVRLRGAVRAGRGAGASRCAPRRSSSTPAACSTSTTSSASTTCGSRPAACGRRWRSSGPASRASATARR